MLLRSCHQAASVPDVASGFSQTGEQVALEDPTGQPALVYVVLPDAPWRIGAGAVYTSYEFPVPSGARLTDEAWQSMLESGQNPAQLNWTQSFTAPQGDRLLPANAGSCLRRPPQVRTGPFFSGHGKKALEG